MSSPALITDHQLNTHPKRFSRENRSTTNPGAILPHESRREFQRLMDEYTLEFLPATEHQRYLVWQLADARFRIARMNRFEQCLWDINDDKRPCRTEDHRIVHDMMQRGHNIYDQLHRYRSAAERTYNKAIKELASFCKAKETLPIPPSGPVLLASCSESSGSFCKTEPPKPQASENKQSSDASAPQEKQAAPAEPSPASPSRSPTIGFVLQTEQPKPQERAMSHEPPATPKARTSEASARRAKRAAPSEASEASRPTPMIGFVLQNKPQDRAMSHETRTTPKARTSEVRRGEPGEQRVPRLPWVPSHN